MRRNTIAALLASAIVVGGVTPALATEEPVQNVEPAQASDAAQAAEPAGDADAAQAAGTSAPALVAESEESTQESATAPAAFAPAFANDPQAEAEAAELTLVAQASSAPSVYYQGHVQDIGWQDWVSNGSIAGTSGQSLRVEALRIRLADGTDGGIEYRGHVQDIGWQDWVCDGEEAGTDGQSLRVEAIQIRLTGNIADDYDVWYRGHVQDIGWQGWVRNGEEAGTDGQSLRVEAIQIIIMPKGAELPEQAVATPVTGDDGSTEATLAYRACVAGMGWQGWLGDGETAGTTGISAVLEAFNAQLDGVPNDELHYSAHVQDIGWQDEVTGGQDAGVPGAGLRMEAITMRLSGSAEQLYDIYYRLHVQDYGWLNWSCNGAPAGSAGQSKRVEALEVVLVPKGEAAPAVEGDVRSFIGVPELSYRGHVQDIGWQDWVADGQMAGTSGQSLRVEAIEAQVQTNGLTGTIQMRGHVQDIGWQDWQDGYCGTSGQGLRVEAMEVRLTGELEQTYDVWYRVHAQEFGWLGWASNGQSAGTSALSLRLEAIEIRLVPKGGAIPGDTSNAYVDGSQADKLGYQNPAGFYQVSSKNVTITDAAQAPWDYVTPSRIGVWATREDCVNAFIQRATEYVGSPYVWNYSCAPEVGVDCIGLVYQCAYACGMDLGGGTGDDDFNPWAHYITGSSGWHSHDANNFWDYGRAMHVSVEDRLPGDVMSYPGHVGIYIGDDTMIEAYTPATGVIYSNIYAHGAPRGCIRLFQ